MGERKKKRRRRSQKPKEYVKELFKIDLMYYKNKIKPKTQSSQWHVMPEIPITFQEFLSNPKDKLSNNTIPNSKQGHLAQGGRGMQLVHKTLLALHPAWQPSRRPAPSGWEASAFVHHLASSAFSLQTSPLPWRFPQPLGLSQLSWFSSILRNMFRKRTETKKLWSKNPCREVNTARRAFRRASHTLQHYFQSPYILGQLPTSDKDAMSRHARENISRIPAVKYTVLSSENTHRSELSNSGHK